MRREAKKLVMLDGRARNNGQLFCSGCHQWLDPTQFRPLALRADGVPIRYRSECERCERSALWRLVKEQAARRSEAHGEAGSW